MIEKDPLDQLVAMGIIRIIPTEQSLVLIIARNRGVTVRIENCRLVIFKLIPVEIPENFDFDHFSTPALIEDKVVQGIRAENVQQFHYHSEKDLVVTAARIFVTDEKDFLCFEIPYARETQIKEYE